MGVQKKYVNRDKDLLCFNTLQQQQKKKKRKKKTTIKTLQNNAQFSGLNFFL